MADRPLKLVMRSRTNDRGSVPFDNGGGPPHDGEMELRVKALESAVSDIRERLAKMDARLDSIATTADLHREISAQTWKLVTFVTGFGSVLCAAVYFITMHAAK